MRDTPSPTSPQVVMMKSSVLCRQTTLDDVDRDGAAFLSCPIFFLRSFPSFFFAPFSLADSSFSAQILLYEQMSLNCLVIFILCTIDRCLNFRLLGPPRSLSLAEHRGLAVFLCETNADLMNTNFRSISFKSYSDITRVLFTGQAT